MPEDFIDLTSDPETDADGVGNQTSELIVGVHRDRDEVGADDKEEGETSDGENIEENLIHQPSVRKDVESEDTFKMVQEVMENGFTNHATEPSSSVTRIKRGRTPSDEPEQPSVHVVYKSLSRASRKKLEELLQEWSKWHARNVPSTDASTKQEVLEDGEETHFPLLCADPNKSTFVSFRVDKRARTDNSGNLDSEWAPLYDRGFTLGLSSADDSGGPKRVEPNEASRCFNCGSYSHSLKDCPRPRDAAAIGLARREHSSRKNSSSGQRGPSRYYQSSVGGKYDGLRPGVLGPELRESLGIGELDPPPWLNRMRELGYPPGYLEEDEDQPSGITIYADEEAEVEYEEGELPAKGEPRLPEKKRMAIDFPGVNTPIPEKADRRLWAAPPGPSVGSGRSSADRRWSPPGYGGNEHRLSLSRTPSFVERERERDPISYDRSPYSGYSSFSDRWSDGGGADYSPPRRDLHRHHHHRHHHYHHRS